MKAVLSPPDVSVDRRLVAVEPAPAGRPYVQGKFLSVDGLKFYVRGVTYGPFRPEADGCEYHTPAVVQRDFAQMAANGINTVRTYTVPPRWLLDAAQEQGIKVIVGVPWEQHIAFLDRRAVRDGIERRVREAVRAVGNHPALLAITLGNEIPAAITRWYGPRRVAAFLKRLYTAAKAEDPQALVTYVNYPTTEYLQLPFLDFVSFNVYLEQPETLSAYLARLQNLAGERPLLMAEIGLDSLRNGQHQQATALQWQLGTAFAAGCAGVCVFAWTDEWYRGGHEIDDWDFGLVDRERRPKAALRTVRQAFIDVPFPADTPWPRVSVVVCTYNGSRTIAETCAALSQLDYPDYEVIIVNDGSTDKTLELVAGYGYRVLDVPNGGLSRARNLGMEAATGELVAYLDDDAWPDPQWLRYLAWTFLTTDHVGVGGPNLAPADDGLVAECVAHSPGGPNHVLLSDEAAEHLPGCNMAFRKSALQAVGGLDAQFHIAGDDVDLCWRLQAAGGTLGFSPAAMVWHHRRNQVKTYLKQQYNYGRAEAMLEAKWPDKYNTVGHATWQGRVYGNGLTVPFGRRWRVYHGVWGSEPFQSLYAAPAGLLASLPLMPEWYLLIVALLAMGVAGLWWTPLLLAAPLALAGAGVLVAQAVSSAAAARLTPGTWRDHLTRRLLIGWLHLAQPVVRLRGRLSRGLSPWRRNGAGLAVPRPRVHGLRPEDWRMPEERLAELSGSLREAGARVICGGPFDAWDLEVRASLLGGVRLLMAVEEHGSGKQYVRLRSWPVASPVAPPLTLVSLSLGIHADMAGHPIAGLLLAALGVALLVRTTLDCAAAQGSLEAVLRRAEGDR